MERVPQSQQPPPSQHRPQPPSHEGAPSDTPKDDEQLDRELEQTFPASDPVPPKHVD